jgi:hypothetical protein
MLVRVSIIRSAKWKAKANVVKCHQSLQSGPRVRTDFQVGLGLAVCLGQDRIWRRALAGLRFWRELVCFFSSED